MSVVVAVSKDRLPSARKLWLTLHLWLGLSAGAVVSFMGLTGSLLVFNDTMLRTELGSNLFDVAGPPPLRLSIDEWIANAHRAFDGLNPIEYILAPGFGHAGEARMGAAAEGG